MKTFFSVIGLVFAAAGIVVPVVLTTRSQEVPPVQATSAVDHEDSRVLPIEPIVRSQSAPPAQAGSAMDHEVNRASTPKAKTASLPSDQTRGKKPAKKVEFPEDKEFEYFLRIVESFDNQQKGGRK